jgi:hypothetical protein
LQGLFFWDWEGRPFLRMFWKLKWVFCLPF